MAYTTYTMPVAPGRSGLVISTLFDSQVARWFPRPAGAGKPPPAVRMVLGASQTSAEPEPRVRVLFFADGGR